MIEEHEKAISAMEAELSLNRAALRHTNEIYEEREELAILQERHSETETYVEELRNRAARLMEREASTEVSPKPCYLSALLTVFSLILQAHVRILEERLKQYDESNLSSYESSGSLKMEIARRKNAETHSTQYIVDLEVRLLLVEESILDLQQAVERLEEAESHR